jgi:TatD DNase family protein
MAVRLVDTHCHLYLPTFESDLPAVLARARRTGVERILVPGIDLPTSRQAVELAETYDGLYAAVGIHPHFADQADAQTLMAIESLAQSPRVRAIGEIGLDFYRSPDSRAAQVAALESQLAIAARLQLPVVLHSRQALDTLLPVLETWARHLPPPLHGRCGVLHAFSGEASHAAQAMNAGFFLGAGGPVTYPSAGSLRATLAEVGLTRVLLETDAPYLAPQAHRGRRNEPAFVGEVAAALGQLTGESAESLTEALRANAARLFEWDHGNHDPQLC